MEKIADIKTNFSQWYQDVVYGADLAEQSPTPGCIVIKPYGYALWENIKQILDEEIKKTGTQNAYFPLLIPESFLKKEKEHVEGFSPELAVVTHAGGKKLEEPLVVRPTSETVIYYMFSKWIKSWRDLPIKINQWANVMRWEMRPRAFIRSREFLWQEGHTAHSSKEEAIEMAKEILVLYKKFVEEYLAISVIEGIKSDSEKFAGADRTYTVEAIMQDGRALQMGTTHVLSHSFSKSFDILYQNEDGKMVSPHCSSWGITTRLIGAIVMVHGDQNGLIMPPRIAPFQVVIVPIYRKEEEKTIVLEKASKLEEELKKNKVRVTIDTDEQKSPGAKFFHWEMKGVPLRVEIGPKDVEKNQVALVSRLSSGDKKQKEFVAFESASKRVGEFLLEIQKRMFDRAKEGLKKNWHQADKLEEFGPALEKENGLYQVGWCGKASCEEKLKSYKATTRCLLDEKKHANCFSCDKPSKSDILVAKAY